MKLTSHQRKLAKNMRELYGDRIQTITIKETPESRQMHKEVWEYIESIKKAQEISSNSKLKFK